MIKRVSVLNKDWKDIGLREVQIERDFTAFETLNPDGSITMTLCEPITDEQYQLRNVGA